MKILINKRNPEIRITATEITTEATPYGNYQYVYWIPAINEMYNPIDWTLVEEEPEKIYYKMLDNKANCPFDKGDCRYCTVQFCGAREENHIETRSTAEPVDLEKEIDFYIGVYFLKCEDGTLLNADGDELRYTDVRKIARHFYELGLKRKEE